MQISLTLSLILKNFLLTNLTLPRPHAEQEQVEVREGKGEGQSQAQTQQRAENPGRCGSICSLRLPPLLPAEAAALTASSICSGMCQALPQTAQRNLKCASRFHPSGRWGEEGIRVRSGR